MKITDIRVGDIISYLPKGVLKRRYKYIAYIEPDGRPSGPVHSIYLERITPYTEAGKLVLKKDCVRMLLSYLDSVKLEHRDEGRPIKKIVPQVIEHTYATKRMSFKIVHKSIDGFDLIGYRNV